MAKQDWDIPPKLQPDPADYAFDLERTLRSVVALHATVPPDAFTAGVLGEDRAGNGIVIADGRLVVTMGYLITEAESVWITTADGRVVAGHALAYDMETGFGLVQPLGRLELPAIEFGDAAALEVGTGVLLAAAGGRRHALETRVVGRQEFAGYWEYLIDDAIFTAPAHPFWGGAALLSAEGKLLGVGSLILQQGDGEGRRHDMNMVVPVSRLIPILPDLTQYGRVNRPPRPWLGIYAMDDDDTVVVGGLAEDGPADRAGVRVGDRVVAAGGESVTDVAALWRRLWAAGRAGVTLELRIARNDDEMDVAVTTADRAQFLRAPRMH